MKITVKDYPKKLTRVAWLARTEDDTLIGVRMYLRQHAGPGEPSTYLGIVVKAPEASTIYKDVSAQPFMDKLAFGDSTVGVDLLNMTLCFEFGTGNPSVFKVKDGPAFIFNIDCKKQELLDVIKGYGFPIANPDVIAKMRAQK